ncbi:electron transfer flavoprotein subunit alpha/FixB family protein [Paenibacillus cremeus]|uniref:Electron transfer flavoprotein subunit alpha/FixB family protein n=1 Tax=Paenibacillus cremeus TaxID=2163881 RepID=A0A559KIP5_9BACL|nr:electron transfer flavoprotein subunit alpha/FixB family protein [Paenibacillus cremeus]TVY11991.1 electron transfer flavoprotein subunit alpha/FixB family protein [Paenibacillus cremeus]
MSKAILVIAEQRGGALRQVTLEALHAAQRIKNEGDAVCVAALGQHIGWLGEALAPYGCQSIQLVDHAELEHYNPEAYFTALKPLLQELQPRAVLLGHTAIGRDLAPMLAAHLNAGQISDIIAIEHSDNGGGDIRFTRPIYAGKAFETLHFTAGTAAAEPVVVTIRPNNLPPAEPVEPQQPDAPTPSVVSIDFTPAPSLRTVVKDVVRKTSGKVDLTEAKIIVSGGRGVKSAEGFQPLEQLAEVLGAAIGASRGACDAGYCDYALQIGQTGKVVTPELYIACGISGAIQHLAGMSQSRVIVAINKDPDAPIFQVADYGIVGDLFEVVPLLTEEFKKALG